ncbi:hypothetical protein OBBRIDRAFT_799698 [Obba rivulosa]|uniref:Uncharacterized protein n=1 Tax=Obba rivulosa TaxID=1052685 RepID=A0A8E2AFT2_9APHY|nr:hypothetical protein OBBRIDRAFT_799698 [Obba rivulosa]
MAYILDPRCRLDELGNASKATSPCTTAHSAVDGGRLTMQCGCMPVGILQLAVDMILYFVWAVAATGGSACALAAVPACINIGVMSHRHTG